MEAAVRKAGIRDDSLHDARHTAATVLLLLAVNERTIMGLMRGSSSAMMRPLRHFERHAGPAREAGPASPQVAGGGGGI